VISDFHGEEDKNCAILGYYAASSGNFLPTFRDDILGPIFKKSKSLHFLALEDGPLGFPETSVRNYHYLLRKIAQKSAALIYLVRGNLKLREIAVVLRTFKQFDRATLEGSGCSSIMTCTGGCDYSF